MQTSELSQRIDLWIGSMSQWNPEEISLDSVPEEERLEAQKFRFEDLRDRALIGKALLRRILAKYTGTSPLAFQIARGEKGKPYLPLYPDLRFNLSHSKDMFLCGVTYGAEIGVDVEAVDGMRDSMAIADRFFARKERALFEGLADSDCRSMFFRCWTRKEAFIKGTGKGLSQDLQSFDVTSDTVMLLACDGSTQEKDSGWIVRSFLPCTGYSAAVASNREISRFFLIPLNRDTLLYES